MNSIIFSFPENEKMAQQLAIQINAESGELSLRKFPDGESYVRVMSDVKNKIVIIYCPLNNIDPKFLTMFFLCQTLRSLGAKKIILVSPYLSYMRQDKVFHVGEGITSSYFATLISKMVDTLVTIDPHLHRIGNLNEIYTIPTYVLNSAELISDWIKQNVDHPLIIGPDAESEQWVSKVASDSNSPYVILSKTRLGDNEVQISLPDIEKFKQHKPVLIDDIISSGGTVIKTSQELKKLGMAKPICICVHALFTPESYEKLKSSEIERIVTCNTIEHPSNEIDILELISSVILNELIKGIKN